MRNKGLCRFTFAPAIFFIATTGAHAGQAVDGAQPAQAASAADDAGSTIEDIVVVARRRSEASQDVPLSISAASGEQLTTLNVSQTKQISLIAPSVTVAPSIGGSTSITLSIRGQRNVQPRLGFDSSIGVYFAGVAVARPYGLNQGLYDLQSVQVLNGPQGTLFGRNTTGGAILFEPNRPSDKFEGSVEAEYGNYNNRAATVVLNLPVSEKLAVRAAGRIVRRDGYTKNLADGRHYDDLHNESGRVSILLKPSDTVSNITVVDYFHNDSNGQMQILSDVIPCAQGGTSDCIYTPGFPFGSVGDALAAQRARGTYVANSNSPISDRENILDIASTTEINVTDDILVKNIFGYRNTKLDSENDLDGSPLSILNVSGRVRAKQLSNELQVQGSTAADKLEYIFGGFLFREGGTDIFTSNALAGLNPAGPAIDGGYVLSKSQALFAQASYHVPGLQGLTLTGGGRYTWDQRSVRLNPHDNFGCAFDRPVGTALPGICPGRGEAKFSAFTWTVGADYKVGSTLVYVTGRHGYRSGGVDLQSKTSAALANPFRPEKVTDVEGGLKRDWAIGGMRFRTNLAVYYGWAKALQRSVRLNANDAVPTALNAASGHIYGTEFQGQLRVSSHFSVNGSFAYNHAAYVKYRSPAGDVYDDDRFAFDPRVRYNLGATYTNNVGDAGDLTANVNWQWSGKYSWDDINVIGAETQSEGLLGASIQLDNIAGTAFGATVFATNLLDNKYLVGGNGNLIGLDAGINAEPRMYGLRLSYRFGE